jgi:diguanylate cyclase (GGDEF)-like protein
MSPVVTLGASCYIYIGFYKNAIEKNLKPAALLMSLGVFSWFIMEVIWAYLENILKINPIDNTLLSYGYTLTSVFIFIAVLIYSYYEIKSIQSIKKNQLILDIFIVLSCVVILTWKILFDNNVDKILNLLKDPIFFNALIMDSCILTVTVIRFFTKRENTNYIYDKIMSLSCSLYVIVDFLYYHTYTNNIYIPNDFIDAGYITTFSLMAVSVIVKDKEMNKGNEKYQLESKREYNKEWIFLIFPIAFIFIGGIDSDGLMIFLVAFLLYYIFTSYNKSVLCKESIKSKEEEFYKILDERVEERTREIINIYNNDILTGLLDRHFYLEYLENRIKRMDTDEKIYLFNLRINKYNNIKLINGRYISDKLLREVSKIIKYIVDLRGGEIGYLGDGIISIFISETSKKIFDPNEFLDEIINTVSDKYYVYDNEIPVTINVGYEIYPSTSKSYEELLEKAFLNMEESYLEGHNKYYYRVESLGYKGIKYAKKEKYLKEKDLSKIIQIYYEPRMNILKNSLTGVKSSVKLDKSEIYISDKEFLLYIKNNNLITWLNYYYIEEVFKEVSVWVKHGKVINVAIKIEYETLIDSKFLAFVDDIIKKYNLSPSIFEFEISEKIRFDENDSIIGILSEIDKKGVGIRIDDFGQGYSSMSYLKKLPAKKINISEELLINIESDLYDFNLIKAVIKTAKIRDVKILAKGVENKEQIHCLKELECDEAEGMYFSNPMCGDDFYEKWLVNKF